MDPITAPTATPQAPNPAPNPAPATPAAQPASGGLTTPATPPPATPNPTPPAPSQETPPVTPATPPQRPEGLADKYWDDATGLKTSDLLTDFQSQSAALAAQQSQAASVPETADGYQVQMPPDYKLPDGVKLPEGMETLSVNPDDPRVAALRDVAQKSGWSQSVFEQVLAAGAEMDLRGISEHETRLGAEREALGGRASERIDAVKTFMEAKLGEELGQALHGSFMTAKSIEAAERLIGMIRQDPTGQPGHVRTTPAAEISDEEWNNMSSSQRIAWARENKKD